MKFQRSVMLIALFLIFAVLVQETHAGCIARHANGKYVPVREIDGFSTFWAHATWAPDGWPKIIYSPTYYKLPPNIRWLTRLHECAHLVEETQNEFIANCEALKIMRRQGLSRQEESDIADFHMSLGALGPQYGGSGAAFWRRTLEYCGKR